MDQSAKIIEVEIGQKPLEDLLKTVELEHQLVRLLRQGKAVAELRPIGQLPPVEESLKATMLIDGYELTTEEDWPEEAR